METDTAENTDELNEEISEEGQIISPDADTENEESGDEETLSENKFSQDQVNSIVTTRMGKLNEKHKAANLASEEDREALALAEEKNKLLKLQLEQQQQTATSKAPNPEDFDLGASDPAYIEKLGNHNESIMKAEVESRVDAKVSEATAGIAEQKRIDTQSAQLQGKQTEHYERVKKLDDVSVYIEREDAALQIFGQDVVNHLIGTFDDSQNLLFYLGTPANLSEAQKIAGLLQTNPILALSEIGGIRATKLKPVPKSSTAPDPDEEVKSTPGKNEKRGPAGATYS